MTGRRLRAAGRPDSATLIDVLFSDEPARRSAWSVGRASRVWRPPTDVFETEDQIVVQVEVAGVQVEDFRIVLHAGMLTISGARATEDMARTARRAYYQMEVHTGEFRVDVELPSPVDVEHIDATYTQGFLRVVLPKQRSERVRIE